MTGSKDLVVDVHKIPTMPPMSNGVMTHILRYWVLVRLSFLMI